MNIFDDNLPDFIVQAAREAKGNFATKNASYRRMVCDYLGLRWISIAGEGNCFFAAVSTSLLATLPPNRTEHPVIDRSLIVNWMTLQMSKYDDLAERVQVEIDAELNNALICSKRGVPRVIPTTREEYLKAVAVDGTWIQGYHWPRAVSTIAKVRVGVVIYPFDHVVYYGEGDQTIYLYKSDVATHFDALVPKSWQRA